MVDWNMVFQLYIPLLQRGTVSNQWYYSVDLKDRVQKRTMIKVLETSPQSSLSALFMNFISCAAKHVASASPVKVSQSKGIL